MPSDTEEIFQTNRMPGEAEVASIPFFEVLRQDMAANPSNAKAKLLMVAFRISHFFATRKNSNQFLWIVGIPIMTGYRVAFEWVLGIELPARTRVGPGLKVMHGQALVVNYMATLGRGCTLRQSTTIGCKILPDGSLGLSPRIGNHVDIGSNVVILGDIQLGDACVVGAGSVVLHDVPAGAVVAGNPAKILRLARATRVP